MNKFINRIPDWLRWLLLVPSIVCYIVVSYYITSGFILLIGTIQTCYWISGIWGTFFVILVSGFFIQFAAYIAPKGKLLVSFIITALILIFSVIYIVFVDYDIPIPILCIIGALICLIVVINNTCNKKYTKELNLDKKIVTKKRVRLYSAVCILMLITSTIGFSMYAVKSTVRSAVRTGTLYVNGKEVTRVSAKIRYDDVVLPLTEVLEGCGFNITWRDDNFAYIMYEGKTHILNFKKASLTKEGFDDIDLIECPPGGDCNYYSKAEGRELFIDAYTLYWVIHYFGYKIDVTIDRDKSIVYVNTRLK